MATKLEKYRKKQESDYHKYIWISVIFSEKEKERERMDPRGNF